MKRMTLVAVFSIGVLALFQGAAAFENGNAAKSLNERHIDRIEMAINQAT